MKRIIALIICLITVFNTSLLTSCFAFGNNQNEGTNKGENEGGNEGTGENNDNGNPTQPEEEKPEGDGTLAAPGIDDPEKYSSFDLPREKLTSAFFEALKKIDAAIPTFTDKFPAHNSENNVYPAVSNTRI